MSRMRANTTPWGGAAAICILFLTACGGGGGPEQFELPNGPFELPTDLSLLLPSGHGLGVGEIRVVPGASEEHGNVVVSCPAGGRACVVTVAADGTATYDRTGGTPTVAAAYGAWDLPSGHGLGVGEIRVVPGASEEHGNVVVSCPAGGRACVVTVAADGTATYDRTGGTPGVAGGRLPFPLLAVPFPHQPLRERAPYSQMPTSTYHYGTSRLPALSRPRLQHQPIYQDDPYVLGGTPLPRNPQPRLLVGIDPGLEPRDLPSHEIEPDRR